jgi:tetratricopeptide (TPR) repeat protein
VDWGRSRWADAEASYQSAQTILERLVRTHPAISDYAVSLGGNDCNLGNLLLNQGKPRAALEWYAKAVRQLGDVLQKEKGHTTAREFLRNTHRGRAVALTRLDDHRGALEEWDQAIEADPGERLDQLRLLRAGTLARLGEHGPATDEAAKQAEKFPKMGGRLLDAARVYSLSAAAARRDDKLPPAERETLAEQYAARAVQLLRRAHAAGYLNNPARVEQLKKDPEFEPLRARDDFRKLLADLEEKARAGAR